MPKPLLNTVRTVFRNQYFACDFITIYLHFSSLHVLADKYNHSERQADKP